MAERVADRTLDWRAAAWAGVIAGAVFMMLEMIMVPAFLGGSAWAPPRMMAAIVLGPDVLPPPATFNLGIFVTALVVHFTLSVVFAGVLAWIVDGWSPATAVIVGVVYGLALYMINFYGFTALFPWFAEARNWVSVFTHAVFGLTAGWAYKELASPLSPAQAAAD